MLTLTCSGCRRLLEVHGELAGKRVRCPHCRQVAHGPGVNAGTVELSAGGEAPRSAPETDPRLDTVTLPADGCAAAPAPPEAVTGVWKEEEFGQLGGFRLLEVLGRGGMGVVYRAEDPHLRRHVALKVLRPDLAADAVARRRFLREARAVAAIEHDNIVAVHQVGEDRGVPFISMPLLRGEPLDARLKRCGALPAPEVVRIGRDVALGLAAAQGRGLVHRDIKPTNLWLEEKTGRVKILDFGLARFGSDMNLASPGLIVGTVTYMAPEQARGDDVDARCDLFSLGCVLFQLCTSEPPFRGESVLATLRALASDPPPPITAAGVPADLAALVMRLLTKDPAGRPASAEAVADALAAIRLRPWPPARVSFWSRRLAAALLVTLGVVPLGGYVAAVVLRAAPGSGTLVVELDGPEAEARVRGGKLVLTGPDGRVRYTLSPARRSEELAAGEYRVRVEGADGLSLDTTEFTLHQGARVVVRVKATPEAAEPAAVAVDPDRRAAEEARSAATAR